MGMTHTQKFIEDAIAGGWHHKGNRTTKAVPHGDAGAKVYLNDANDNREYVLIEEILLDPLAWQAVGKTRGWREINRMSRYWNDPWKRKLHRFIDHLADGKTVDEALAAIS